MKNNVKTKGLSQAPKKMLRLVACYFLPGLGLMLSPMAFSAESVWQDIGSTSSIQLNKSTNSLSPSLSKATKQLTKFRALSLNESLLKERLSMSGSAQTNQLARSQSVAPADSIMTIPLPDDKSVRVRLEQTQVMAPGLAAKHPEIKTWKAAGLDNSHISGRVDFTSYGFHAMLTMPDGDTVFVERADKNSNVIYNSFSKRAN